MKTHYHTQLDAMRQQGHRITPQRQIVLDALIKHGGHATIAELEQSIAAGTIPINKATVYRILEFFSTNQLISKTEMGGQTYYELIGHERHHHLICTECGHIAHLHDHHFTNLVTHLADEHQFFADINHLAIHGLCYVCNKNKE